MLNILKLEKMELKVEGKKQKRTRNLGFIVPFIPFPNMYWGDIFNLKGNITIIGIKNSNTSTTSPTTTAITTTFIATSVA